MLLVPSAIFEMIECRLSSLLGRKKIELERNEAYSFDRKLTHGCKDNKPAVNDDSSNESSPRRSSRSVITQCKLLTRNEHPGKFPFSRFLGEKRGRKPRMHASLKCENERKERASSAVSHSRTGTGSPATWKRGHLKIKMADKMADLGREVDDTWNTLSKQPETQ